ncbi:hypothetical protein MKX01_016726 [Papaver californicum]|nr:hypothetical protein MKX01_016726 [Papaver californicum]
MRTIYFKVYIFFLLLLIIDPGLAADSDKGFTYNDFRTAFITRDGAARITDNGLLQLTDLRDKYVIGHAFYSGPLKLKGSVSFSTTFVFAIASELGPNKLSGQGMAFVIAPQRALPGALANQYLGLINDTSNGQSTNNVLAVEIDTVYNVEFDTIQGPSTAPAYFVNGEYKHVNINSGEPVQVWVEYDGIDKRLTPDVPLLSLSKDLSTIFLDDMYVGFSASTQNVLTYHYMLGWSFQIDGVANALNLSSLPTLPPKSSSSHDTKPNLAADPD